ncbi:MAG: hypothetical protein E7616_04365 [Ruminococcaceae bacterium]|nr:hypothetical protein [Oscillospiraceae bacterium]
MKEEILMDAISEIDADLVDAHLKMREMFSEHRFYRRIAWRKALAVAACAILVMIAPLVIPGGYLSKEQGAKDTPNEDYDASINGIQTDQKDYCDHDGYCDCGGNLPDMDELPAVNELYVKNENSAFVHAVLSDVIVKTRYVSAEFTILEDYHDNVTRHTRITVTVFSGLPVSALNEIFVLGKEFLVYISYLPRMQVKMNELSLIPLEDGRISIDRLCRYYAENDIRCFLPQDIYGYSDVIADKMDLKTVEINIRNMSTK